MNKVSSASDLHQMSRSELHHTLQNGHPIDPAGLDNRMYRGVSLGLPGWLVHLTWLTFRKTFYRDPASGQLRGWNVRMEQTGIDGKRTPKMRRGQPHTFGHYDVIERGAHRIPVECAGLLIHYGVPQNPLFDPIRRVRDPLVAIHAGSTELLLGWSYLDLGFGCLGTPSYFSLEYEGPLDYVPEAAPGLAENTL